MEKTLFVATEFECVGAHRDPIGELPIGDR